MGDEQPLDGPPSSGDPSPAPAATFGGRDLIDLGGVLVGGVVGGLVIGLVLDHLLGTAPVCVLVGIALGIALACLAFVGRVRRALED